MPDLTPEEFERRLDGITDDLRGVVAKKMLLAGELIAGGIARAVHQTMKPNRAGKTRTGNLARSFRPSLVEQQGRVGVGVFPTGPAAKYAAIQDQGGKIFPSSRKALAVPISGSTIGRWPRDFPRGELFMLKRKGGKAPLLVKRVGDGIVPMFVLLKSVTIDAKNYVELGWRIARPDVEELLERELEGMFQARFLRG